MEAAGGAAVLPIRAITFREGDAPVATTLDVTEDLEALFDFAIQINRARQHSPDLSFDALSGAFLLGEDEVSAWARKEASRGANLEAGLAPWLQGSPLRSLISRPPIARAARQEVTLTPSVSKWLADARYHRNWANTYKTIPVSSWHWMAGWLWLNDVGEQGFEELRVHRALWRAAFAGFASEHAPSGEERNYFRTLCYEIPYSDLGNLDASSWVQSVLAEARTRVLGTPLPPVLTTATLFGAVLRRGRAGGGSNSADWLVTQMASDGASSIDWHSETSVTPVRRASTAVKSTLARASDLARATTGSRTIHGRHLVAAMLCPTDEWEPARLQEAIWDKGYSLDLLRKLRKAFFQVVPTWSIDDNKSAWLQALAPTPASAAPTPVEPPTPVVVAPVATALESRDAALAQKSTQDTLEATVRKDPRPLAPNQVLGNYRLISFLGSGGFSVVWLAEQVDEPDKRVAIKVFSANNFRLSERGRAVARFWQGAAIAKQMGAASSIVPVIAGPMVTENLVWFAMPLFREGNLYRWMSRPPLSLADRMTVVDDVLEALAAARQARVVHRDLRPDNILVEHHEGRLCAAVADFDVAHYEHALGVQGSTTAVLGRPRYLPPEVLGATPSDGAGALRDPRIDLYSLSVLVFDLFAGGGANLPADRSTRQFLASLSNGPADLPPGPVLRRIAKFCSAGLGLDTRTRYQDLKQLKQNWERAKTDPVWVHVLGGFVVLALTALTLVLADWVSYRGSETTTERFLDRAYALALVAVAAMGGMAWIKAALQRKLPEWRAVAGTWIGRRPAWALALAAILVTLTAVSWFGTDASRRMHTYRVITDNDCIGRDEQGHVVRRFEAGDRQEQTLSVIPAQLQCPEQATVLPRSALCPQIPVVLHKTSFEVPPALTVDRLKDRLSTGRLRVLDVAVDGTIAFVLCAEQVSGEIFLRNPDGDLSYDNAVYVVRIELGAALIRRFTTLPMLTSKLTSLGALTVHDELVTAFVAYKVGEADYGMGATLYNFTKDKLTPTTYVPIFGATPGTSRNWGFYPRFEGNDVLHFSYDGYRLVRGTTALDVVSPDEMQKTREAWQRRHSMNTWPSDQLTLVSNLLGDTPG